MKYLKLCCVVLSVLCLLEFCIKMLNSIKFQFQILRPVLNDIVVYWIGTKSNQMRQTAMSFQKLLKFIEKTQKFTSNSAPFSLKIFEILLRQKYLATPLVVLDLELAWKIKKKSLINFHKIVSSLPSN